MLLFVSSLSVSQPCSAKTSIDFSGANISMPMFFRKATVQVKVTKFSIQSLVNYSVDSLTGENNLLSCVVYSLCRANRSTVYLCVSVNTETQQITTARSYCFTLSGLLFRQTNKQKTKYFSVQNGANIAPVWLWILKSVIAQSPAGWSNTGKK